MSRDVVPKIESKDFSLADLFKDFYSVPDFQREYVWNQENAERLLDDILNEFYDEERRLMEGSEYFVGSIVVCPGKDGTFHLIDGQQRLTTIYLILCAVRDCLTDVGSKPPETLQAQITAASMDPFTGEDIFRYRIALQYEDSDGVLEKIAHGTVPTKDIPETTMSVRNILAAYLAIREFLEINFDKDPTRIKRFLAAFTLRVKLIRIVTPNLANALKVFETINDRGVGLNAMDLLKNLLFMKTPEEQYPKLKERWKELVDTLDRCGEKPLRFLRYYIMSHYEIDWTKGIREDEIYQWLSDHGEDCGIDEKPLIFLDRLVARAKAYANFIEGKDVHGSVNRYLCNIRSLSGSARQHFVLLLAGQHLLPDLFTELCRQIENLFFCYVITRESGKTFERNFTRWSEYLRDISSGDELEVFLNRYFKPELISRSRNFDFAFQELSQSRIQKYRMRYILAKLTQFIEEQAWGNPAHSQLDQYLDSSVHVEHILPQSPTSEAREAFDKGEEYDSYVEKLGNLTLLEKTINTSVSNGMYEDKRPGYQQSAFLLTKSLVEKPQVGTDTQLNRAVEDLEQFATWNSKSIDSRQSMLGRLARKVWEITEQPANE